MTLSFGLSTGQMEKWSLFNDNLSIVYITHITYYKTGSGQNSLLDLIYSTWEVNPSTWAKWHYEYILI